MCEQLLANPLIESYEIELRGRRVSDERDRPLVAVPFFPGSNDDRDAVSALERLGADARRVWHDEPELPDGTAAVVLPGGFSYGDYLRCGAIARFSPIMARGHRVRRRRRPRARDLQRLPDPHRGGPAARRAARERVAQLRLPRRARCASSDVDTPFTSRCTTGQELTIPVKHGEGCWFADRDLLAELEANGQIVLRYAAGENPNGAVDDVAGVRNAAGNVFGLMPHPEHAVDPLLGSTDGALILGSLVDAARLSSAALV